MVRARRGEDGRDGRDRRDRRDGHEHGHGHGDGHGHGHDEVLRVDVRGVLALPVRRGVRVDAVHVGLAGAHEVELDVRVRERVRKWVHRPGLGRRARPSPSEDVHVREAAAESREGRLALRSGSGCGARDSRVRVVRRSSRRVEQRDGVGAESLRGVRPAPATTAPMAARVARVLGGRVVLAGGDPAEDDGVDDDVGAAAREADPGELLAVHDGEHEDVDAGGGECDACGPVCACAVSG